MMEYLFALSLRFFFFDFILFRPVRLWLDQQHYLLRKLLRCPFCQGFWCGLFVWPWSQGVDSLIRWGEFAFGVAFLAFTWSVIMDPLIAAWEAGREIKITDQGERGK
ncbi:hypothetical protein [Heliophilum fasciatum]|uniref:DUF1360 domain-containing protein n=1 Tax=Heliophilum fasciatum TaxID=35700 RepID=A0A4R2S8W6_9FIRM|nr:hypothetical protein [Heliophilum fasciatum]MCW2276758.1 phosphoglycerol transferase MdoB-like AlkP superfamily enzyme [Heliophilum fasciatum]TCP68861.1 hypothetical protein EDD73_10122 [Heliophilum fasciatum]